MRHQWIGGLLVSVSMLLSGLSEASPQGKRVAFLSPPASTEFIAELNRAFTTRAAGFGMTVTNSFSPYDPALQAQQVDDAIAQKFDLLALVPVSEQAILPSLVRAKRAGVPVFLLVTPPKDGTDDTFTSWVGEDNVELGRIAARQMLKALAESGRDRARIALVTGALHEGVAPRRVAGFKEVMAANPNVEIVATEDARWDTALSERLAGQLIARFAARGGLDGIYAMADNQSLAVIQAAEAAGRKVGAGKGEFVVVGSNCIKSTAGLIRSGKLYSSGSQVPTRTGILSAELIADYFNGKPVPKYVAQPVEAITKDNLDKWEKPCTF
jgi:ribose transport system substrate-binding protein